MNFKYLLLFISIPFLLFSQDNKKEAVVSASKMNYLYRGIINPLKIGVEGISNDKISIECTNGVITKGGNECEIIPGIDKSTTIIVYVKEEKIYEKEFIILDLPDPIAGLCGKRNCEEIQISTIKNDPFLYAKIPDLPEVDYFYEIVSFNLSVSTAEGIITESSNSSAFTEKQLELLEKVKVGDYIYFSDIIVKFPRCSEKKIKPLFLIIV
ncbi:MAG: hypothetical protein A2W91_14580 [Bacteroidetes bacterium GWF2_38_335]|nr:MAG: hypothetical protein A2W91_14580 [Bacteroidetes bacterium GWF2_38_335]OFY79316.1 MAG: hypothetical protein A2281_16575 [Bacteroidetes bacterium RIFOXYA12_FULL_38_20]HBS85573.1 hypothetical protein [Bacteroidales bacterium]